MLRTPRTRRGSALMMVMAIVLVLLALTWTLSTNTVARLQAERARDDQIELIAACESAANETVAWMTDNPDLVKPSTALGGGVMVEHGEIILNYPLPEAQFNAANVLTGSAKISSASTPAILPALTVNTVPTSTAVGCGAGMRNGCAVESIIICLKGTDPTKYFPDGNEKYLVFATATKGDKTSDAARFQRRRIMTVINPQPTTVFKQTMYAISSYDVGGSAGSDSWNGTAVYTGSGVSTHHGDVKSGGTVTTSGSATVDGAIVSNVKLPLPTLTYTPSASANGHNFGALTTAQTLTGGTDYRASSVTSGADITITGAGTVTLYVDGPFNTDSIRFAPGSTASLVIKQANYSPSLGDTSFDLGGLVGDIDQTSGGAHADYTSQNDPAKGPDATRLQFYSGYTGSMKFNGNGAAAAVIYAPGADIQMNGTFQFFGAIIADGFSGKVNGTFNFHFDDRLGSMSIPMNPQFSATGWNIYNVAVNQN